jgi:nitrogen regulatory protein P-II 1
MKRVQAIVDNSKLSDVRASLARAGVDGMTVTDVLGYERENGQTQQYRGAEHKVQLLPKVRVEIIVEDGRVPALLEEILRATRTGKSGDGKIFVLPVDDAVRIRTNERGRDAL